MRLQFLIGAMGLTMAAGAGAQTPTQETGSVQGGAPLVTRDPIAPTQSISIEGITPDAKSPLSSSTAPDSGPQPWKDVMGWITLQPGMTAEEVKNLLGADFRESVKPDVTLWTYQDQKALLFGSVMFKAGKLEAWSSPRF